MKLKNISFNQQPEVYKKINFKEHDSKIVNRRSVSVNRHNTKRRSRTSHVENNYVENLGTAVMFSFVYN